MPKTAPNVLDLHKRDRHNVLHTSGKLCVLPTQVGFTPAAFLLLAVLHSDDQRLRSAGSGINARSQTQAGGQDNLHSKVWW